MKVDDDLIDHLSNLAKLHFEGEEKEAIKEDLEKILNFVSSLEEVDTTNVEPLIYMNDDQLELREDETKPALPQQESLKNAPSKDSDYFKVPKVLDKSAS